MWKTHVSRSKLNVPAVAPVTEKKGKERWQMVLFFLKE